MFLFWLVVGILLAAVELVVPGAVLVFVGLGALTSATMIYFGLIDSWVIAFICWFISSIVYLFTLRGIALRLFPGDEEVANTDEDREMMGQIVLVHTEISPQQAGRIHFLDTTWVAESKSLCEISSQVKIVSRRGNVFVVEPVITTD